MSRAKLTRLFVLCCGTTLALGGCIGGSGSGLVPLVGAGLAALLLTRQGA